MGSCLIFFWIATFYCWLKAFPIFSTKYGQIMVMATKKVKCTPQYDFPYFRLVYKCHNENGNRNIS